MSNCVCHMQKMKMNAVSGIQSHNQREHRSKKNNDIDYEKSKNNYDIINGENVSYRQIIKDRIDELDLKKAVRHDAVVYSSFIISSDKAFFEDLGREEHIRRSKESDSFFLGLTSIEDFDYCGKEYRERCIMNASRRFFEDAADFFCVRYGTSNIVNANVHFDESTPHMHLGVVPVTKDGRLSAKSLFTKQELTSLQTDFAKFVGEKYGLSRGKEGSQVKHLDEVSYKLQIRSKQLEEASNELNSLKIEKNGLERQIEGLQGHCSDLENKINVFEKHLDDLEEESKLLDMAVKKKSDEAERVFGSTSAMRTALDEARKKADFENKMNLFEKFLDSIPNLRTAWENFQTQFSKAKKQSKGRDLNER